MIERRLDDPWARVLRSCERAVTILRSRSINIETLTERNMPANWQELKRLHLDLWRRVYGKV